MLENQVERPDEFLSAWLFDSIPFPLCCHVRMREGASPHAARVWAWLDFVGCTWTSLTMETEACLPGAAGNRLALTVPITGPDRECGGGRAQTKRKASSRSSLGAGYKEICRGLWNRTLGRLGHGQAPGVICGGHTHRARGNGEALSCHLRIQPGMQKGLAWCMLSSKNRKL